MGNVQDHDGSRIDDEAAVNDYMGRLRAMMGSIGWKVDDSGSKAFKRPFSEADIRFAKSMLERISYIDIVAIINAYRDDGWVMMPDGTLYEPLRWAELMGKMDQRIREQLYCQGGCISHQEFVDRYAEEHKKMFGEVWGPYGTDEDKRKEDES